MDEKILIIVIGGIIILQLTVFTRNMIRIFSYKQAIGKIDNYKIKHSIVPEEYIDEISVREILTNNIPEAQNPLEADGSVHDEVVFKAK